MGGRALGTSGNHAAAIWITFIAPFSFTGTVDAWWRMNLVSLAKRHWDREEDTLDGFGRSAMRLVNLPSFTLPLQFAVAAFFVWRFG